MTKGCSLYCYSRDYDSSLNDSQANNSSILVLLLIHVLGIGHLIPPLALPFSLIQNFFSLCTQTHTHRCILTMFLSFPLHV